MKRNLLSQNTANHIIVRANNLSLESKAIWGEMTVTEMLEHCNSCNRQILEEEGAESKTSGKQFLLRILALYLAPKFTKGRKSEERHISKGKVNDSSFSTKQREFKEIINLFPQNNKQLTLSHPAFGNISTNEWGIAAYKHMDHHLRQFGV